MTWVPAVPEMRQQPPPARRYRLLVVPADYENFFVASTQASATLTGLLFVAVSIAPHRVFGEQAEPGRQAQALSAFTAFVNVFFISFGALVPRTQIGGFTVVLGSFALIQTLSLLRLLGGWRRQRTLLRGVVLFLGSGALYGYEIALGLQLLLRPSRTEPLEALVEVLLAAYGVGLIRAWEVLGGRGSGLLSVPLERLGARFGRRSRRGSDGDGG
jgi:hypothetical protein